MSLMGYRWWFAGRWPEGEWRLRSLTQELWWDGPRLTALLAPRISCSLDCFWKPLGRCACGIYACKTQELGVRAAHIGPDGLYPVFGEVALWGRVVEHERGFRAEHAMIRGLVVPERIVISVEPCGTLSLCGILDDFGPKRRRTPEPAPLLRGCVITGDRKWRDTAERIPERAMLPALARVYGVDVELGRAVER
jgi:hypothetical protein